MQRILFAAGAALIMGHGAWAQLGSVKDSQMCKQDPNNVLCHPGEPDQFKMYRFNGTELVKPPSQASPQPVIPPVAQAARPAATRTPVKPLDLSKVDWRFAHPKPDVLLSINLGNIVRSPFLRESLEQSFNMSSDADRAKLDAILKMVGSVDRMQISLAAAPPKEEGPDYLILITGNLDPFVRLMLTQQSKDNKVVSREIAPNAILFGKVTAVDLAAQRMSGVTAPFIADELSSSDVWIGGDTRLLKSASGMSTSPLPLGLDTIKRFALGLNFRDPVQLNANFSMLNETEAKKMLSMYQLLAAQAADSPDSAELVKAAKASVEGAEVHFRFSASLSMLQGQMKKSGVGAAAASADVRSGALASLMSRFGMGAASGGSGAPQAAPSTAPSIALPAVQQAAPPAPGKIMIYGLDDGPREVGAPKKNQ